MDKTQKFDLEERTSRFAVAVVRFCRALPSSPVNAPLIAQLVRAGTSVGANYCEANDAESPRDFRHKLGICRKEARECMYWLRIITVAVPDQRAGARNLWQEAKELNLIFGAALRTLDKKSSERDAH